MIRFLSKSLAVILIGGCLLFVASACGDDPFLRFPDQRDNKTYNVKNINGTLWFAEDLRFEDSIAYSYQQALNACPPGWSLPDQDDWAELSNYFGGYNYDGESIGNPSQAYSDMIKKFGASEDAFYWTSTPAWDDAPSIRSSVLYLNSYKGAAEHGAIIVNFRLRCRCIQKATPQSAADIVQFKVENQVKSFDFYRIDQHPEVGHVDLFLHRRLGNNLELVDRVDLHFQLPTGFIDEQDPPVEALQARLDHQSSRLPDLWASQGHSLNSQQDFDLIFTFYDGSVVKGKFSGVTYDSIAVDEGTFELNVRQ